MFTSLGVLGGPHVGDLRPVPESYFISRSPSPVTCWEQVSVAGWGAEGLLPAVGGGPQGLQGQALVAEVRTGSPEREGGGDTGRAQAPTPATTREAPRCCCGTLLGPQWPGQQGMCGSCHLAGGLWCSTGNT